MRVQLPFKELYSLEKRRADCIRIRERFPDRIPIIVERYKSADSDVPHIDKAKYLVPGDLTFGQFVYVIRKRLALSSEKALFLYVKNTLPASSKLISTLYATHADAEDGFLYVIYSSENTFGSK